MDTQKKWKCPIKGKILEMDSELEVLQSHEWPRLLALGSSAMDGAKPLEHSVMANGTCSHIPRHRLT